MADIETLYERLQKMPFPVLGKQIGDFALYDGLLAGCVDRACQGHRVEEAEVPLPDEETARRVSLLRSKKRLNEEEQAFLEYFDGLERLRLALQPPVSE